MALWLDHGATRHRDSSPRRWLTRGRSRAGPAHSPHASRPVVRHPWSRLCARPLSPVSAPAASVAFNHARVRLARIVLDIAAI